MTQAVPVSEARRYLDVQEVADYIRSTVLTVRVKTSRREIPYIKCGRRVLYDRTEIDAWLAAQRVPVEGC
jgi:excisionase family DNA binding protein